MYEAQVLLVVSAGAVIGFIVVLVVYLTERKRHRLLKTSGVVTQATVTKRTDWVDADESGVSEYHGINYRFVHGGSTFTKSVSVSRSVYCSVREGDTVTIVYVPSTPTISRLKGSYEEPSTLGIVLLGSVVLALVLLCAIVYALSRLF